MRRGFGGSVRGAPRNTTGVEAAPRIVRVMLARFTLEIHLWAIPMLFATGYVIGYFHFRRKNPDLYAEWERRKGEQPKEPR